MKNLKKKIVSAVCSFCLLATMAVTPVSASKTNNIAANLGGDLYTYCPGLGNYAEKGFLLYAVNDTSAPAGDNWAIRAVYPGAVKSGSFMQLTQHHPVVEAGTKVRMTMNYRIDWCEATSGAAVQFRPHKESETDAVALKTTAADNWKTWTVEYVSDGTSAYSCFFIQDKIDITFDDIKFTKIASDGTETVIKNNTSSLLANSKVPAAVTELTATVDNNGNAVLSFTPPATSDVAIYEYNVYEIKNGSKKLKAVLDYDATGATLAGYDSDEGYEFAVETVGINLKKSALTSAVYGTIKPDPDAVTFENNYITADLMNGAYTHCPVGSTEKGYFIQQVYDTTTPVGDKLAIRVNFPGASAANKYMQITQYQVGSSNGITSGTNMRMIMNYRIDRWDTTSNGAVQFGPNGGATRIFLKGVASDEWKTWTVDYVSTGADTGLFYINDSVDITIDNIKFVSVADDGTETVVKNNPCSVWGNSNIPSVVTNLAAVENQDGTITLNYALPESSNPALYKIRAYQSVNGEWKQLGAVEGTKTSVTVTPDANGAKLFGIKTVGRNLRESDIVSISTAVIEIDAAATATSDTATLTWDYTNDVSTYKAVEIYKSTNGVRTLVATVPATQKKLLVDVEAGTHEFSLVPVKTNGSRGDATVVSVDTTGLMIKKDAGIGNSAYPSAWNANADESYFFNQVYDADNSNWMLRAETTGDVKLGYRQHGITATDGATYRLSFKYKVLDKEDNALISVQPKNNDTSLKFNANTDVSNDWKTFSCEYTSATGDADHSWIYFEGVTAVIDDYIVENISDPENPVKVTSQGFGGYGAQWTGSAPSITMTNVTDVKGEADVSSNVVLSWTMPEVNTNFSKVNIYEKDELGNIALIKTVNGDNTNCVLPSVSKGQHEYGVEVLSENYFKPASIVWVNVEAPGLMNLSFDKTSISEGKVTASVEFNNYAMLNKESTLIIALYNNDKFVEMTTATPEYDITDTLPISFTTSVTVPQIVEGDNYTVKAFVWKSVSSLEPLCKAIALGE